MKQYVLDTDVCGFVQSEQPAVMERLSSLQSDASTVTTIITFGEDLGGWLPACRRARDGAERAKAYIRLQRGLDFYLAVRCLPFDGPAVAIFNQLRAQRLRVGTNDLAIAANHALKRWHTCDA